MLNSKGTTNVTLGIKIPLLCMAYGCLKPIKPADSENDIVL